MAVSGYVSVCGYAWLLCGYVWQYMAMSGCILMYVDSSVCVQLLPWTQRHISSVAPCCWGRMAVPCACLTPTVSKGAVTTQMAPGCSPTSQNPDVLVLGLSPGHTELFGALRLGGARPVGLTRGLSLLSPFFLLPLGRVTSVPPLHREAGNLLNFRLAAGGGLHQGESPASLTHV